jgi:tripartite motif-containing protein 71
MWTLARSLGTFAAFAALVNGSGTPVATAPLPLTVVHVRSIGGGPRPGHFNAPRGIAVDRAGRVFVADRGYCRIQVFNEHGRFLHMWGTRGSAPGQFLSPWNLALDTAGQVYVTDAGNHRVQVFTADGIFLRAWGTQGAAPGQFTHPGGIAVDGDGNVFVSDRNDRVQMFTSEGGFVRAWGSRGQGDGQFTPLPTRGLTGPGGIAVSQDGLVYVADSWSSRVQVFTRTGEFVRKFGSIATLNSPEGLALDTQGHLFVAEEGRLSTRGGYSIQKFTGDGEFLKRWGRDGFAPGHFDSPAGVAVDAAGNFYVADSANNRVQKFNKYGQFLIQWGSICDGCLRGPSGIAIDHEGRVLVVDSANRQVQTFASDGRFVSKWNAQPGRIVADARRVYVFDWAHDGMQVFDTSGLLLATLKLQGISRGFVMRGMLLREGQLLVAGTQRLLAFNTDGVLLAQRRSPRTAWATDLALDARGWLYFAETDAGMTWSRIRAVDAEGREVARWNLDAPGDLMNSSRHVAVDRQARVFVSGWGCHIRIFTATGAPLGEWGSCGFGDGQFDNIADIAIDAAGLVYVSDYLNNRVQVFRVREPSPAPSASRP